MGVTSHNVPHTTVRRNEHLARLFRVWLVTRVARRAGLATRYPSGSFRSAWILWSA